MAADIQSELVAHISVVDPVAAYNLFYISEMLHNLVHAG